MKMLKSHWPLVLALITLWGGVACVYADCIATTGGHFVYPTDDTYIHMAMAGNLAEHGTWGMTADEFSSTSSSPLWTLLMALAFLVFGRHELIPLFMNLAVSTLLVWTLYLILRQYGLWRWMVALVLVSAVFLVPMIPMTLLGMEHMLHALLAAVFLFLSARLLATEETDAPKVRTWPWLTLLTACAMTATRYEGLFMVLVIFLLLALRRRYLYAAAIMVAGTLPVVVYGVISVMKGWYFVPNSIMLKAHGVVSTNVLSLLWGALKTLAGCSPENGEAHLMILFISAAALLLCSSGKARGVWKGSSVMLLTFLAATLLHVRYAGVGWFFRYEAYLILLGLMVVSTGLYEMLKDRPEISLRNTSWVQYIAATMLVTVAAVPLITRGITAINLTPRACKNIHDQQYQMGSFLSRSYNGKTVALNDIGAVCYLADIKLVDLVGLATMDAGKARRTKTFTMAVVEKICGSVDVAIVYDSWFAKTGGLPPQWRRIGQWKLPDNVICGDSTVSFYAVRPGTDEQLAQNLREFSPQLPTGIIESGAYMSTVR